MAAKELQEKFSKVDMVLAKKRCRRNASGTEVLYLVRWQTVGPSADSWEKSDHVYQYAREKYNQFSIWAVKTGLASQYNIARMEAKSSPRMCSSQVTLQPHRNQFYKFFVSKKATDCGSISVKPVQKVKKDGNASGRTSVAQNHKKLKTNDEISATIKPAKSYHTFSVRSGRIQAMTHQNRRTMSDSSVTKHRPLLLSDLKKKSPESKTLLSNFQHNCRKSSASSGSSDSDTLYSLNSAKSRSHPTYFFKKATGLTVNCRFNANHASGVSTPDSEDLEVTFKMPSVPEKDDSELLDIAAGQSSCLTATPPQSEDSLNMQQSAPMSPPLNFDVIEKSMQNLQSTRITRRFRQKNGTDLDSDMSERRVSVRQSENAFRYREIVVKKCSGFTQIWLFTQTPLRNAINPEVSTELQQALNNASQDDTRVVMLTGSNGTFCSGVDLHYLLNRGPDAATKMADAVRSLVHVLISFPKPIVAVVNGAAIGLGMALLPLCDIIYASDKAVLCCPYVHLAQTPEGGSTNSFPAIMGFAMANEVLLAGRCLTAMEACQVGLVSRVFWPTVLMQEAIPRIEHMAKSSGQAMEGSKLLLRSQANQKIKHACDGECRVLKNTWVTPECTKAISSYLSKDNVYS